MITKVTDCGPKESLTESSIPDGWWFGTIRLFGRGLSMGNIPGVLFLKMGSFIVFFPNGAQPQHCEVSLASQTIEIFPVEVEVRFQKVLK